MMSSIVLFVCVVFFGYPSSAQAGVHVAFFEIRDTSGRLVQLEVNGRFAHVAISYRGGWLHAHPIRGVERVESLSEIGAATEILVQPSLPDLSEANVAPFLGRAYDPRFRWDDLSSTYCSKLVAQLLAVEPIPMTFATEHWSDRSELPHLEPGLSPDDLYTILKSGRGFASNTCLPVLGK